MTDRRPVPSTPAEAPPTRPAATVLLLRDAIDGDGDGMEVLMLRRHARSGFAASAWVFPGGVVDASDATLPDTAWRGIDPEALAERFALTPTETLAMHAAAVRETFEEAGVLLATSPDGGPVNVPADALAAMRHDLNDRTVTADWAGFLDRHGVVLDLSTMTYWLRWVTPIQEPKRYDTSFFLARVPDGAQPRHDSVETTETQWVNPRAATAPDSGFEVIFPTWKTLKWMTGHDSVDALIAAAADAPAVTPIQPHILIGDDGAYTGILMPDDDGYPTEVYQ